MTPSPNPMIAIFSSRYQRSQQPSERILARSYCLTRHRCLSWVRLLFSFSAATADVSALMATRPKPNKRSHGVLPVSSEYHDGTPSKGGRLETLKLVSMNLAGCQPSAEAPRSWGRSDVTDAVREELLRSDPDILALQECPNKDWATETFAEAGYSLLGVEPAHAGNVMLLLKSDLAKLTTTLVKPFDLPAVMVKMSFQNQSLVVASCHLEPFGEGAEKRQSQMEAMLRASRPFPLIVAGDTNMRVAEDVTMEAALKFHDAWKLAGSNPATKFSWNTRDNKGGSFNRYYGADTRQYVARYDRIYMYPRKAVKMRVSSFDFIANKPVAPSGAHFLSDHFGLSCALRIEWNQDLTRQKF